MDENVTHEVPTLSTPERTRQPLQLRREVLRSLVSGGVATQGDTTSGMTCTSHTVTFCPTAP